MHAGRFASITLVVNSVNRKFQSMGNITCHSIIFSETFLSSFIFETKCVTSLFFEML